MIAENYRPSKDQWAMDMVDVVATRSEDPSTQVGCVIIDLDGRIVSTGYNGLPKGLDTRNFTLSERPIKYRHVVHAEMNAILFGDRRLLEGSTLYVGFMPCCECAKAIIQTGVSWVIFKEDYETKDQSGGQDIGLEMMSASDIRVRRHIPDWAKDDLERKLLTRLS